ncbi:MAG TPA: alternate-type signal peptide domain-containing protein [Marmoricola sp.]|jgi:alternate signal-mediated exported protein|nr:alternate-type signal peptide domain-containing protein [Marmoricola sp.]
MHKSTKGALAAAAAGALLLGGAGTLAYWTGNDIVPGGTFTSGYLQLTDNTCATATWKLDGGTDYTTQRIVPGDSLTKTCTFSVDGVGDHMTVSLDTATPNWSATNALTDALDVTAAFSGSVSGTLSDPATVTKSETITAVITVTFDSTSGDETNVPTGGLDAALDDVTITATQGHSAA